MWNQQLGRYISTTSEKYVVLKDGREIKRNEISDEEYAALKEWDCIVKEFDR